MGSGRALRCRRPARLHVGRARARRLARESRKSRCPRSACSRPISTPRSPRARPKPRFSSGTAWAPLTILEYLRNYGAGRVSRVVLVDQSPRMLTAPDWPRGALRRIPRDRLAANSNRRSGADFAAAWLALQARGNAVARAEYERRTAGSMRRPRRCAGWPAARCWRCGAACRARLPRRPGRIAGPAAGRAGRRQQPVRRRAAGTLVRRRTCPARRSRATRRRATHPTPLPRRALRGTSRRLPRRSGRRPSRKPRRGRRASASAPSRRRVRRLPRPRRKLTT